MTGLRMWLAGILNAHIERRNVVAADEPVTTGMTLDEAVERERRDHRLADAMRAELDRQRRLFEATRPCWACGDPAGFHAVHWPCWNAPPFTRKSEPVMRTYGDGGLL